MATSPDSLCMSEDLQDDEPWGGPSRAGALLNELTAGDNKRSRSLSPAVDMNLQPLAPRLYKTDMDVNRSTPLTPMPAGTNLLSGRKKQRANSNPCLIAGPMFAGEIATGAQAKIGMEQDAENLFKELKY